jgi:hypothetical protein
MATSSLYGTSSESTGLYGIGAASGGTYFEWFIFQDSATAPATPTGGSWSFTTNTGTAPTGWVVSPPPAPVNQVWVSIAIVDSRSTSTFVWSVPGLMTGSGLPILTGAGVPSSGTGANGQLYINTSTTPQSLYNKQAGAWVQLTGSTLYMDLTSTQTVAGTKTFSNQIQGSVSGTAANVTGVVAVANGGTGASTASDARTNLSVPSTTGTGASGTWGINVTGNAATATTATSVTGVVGDVVGTTQTQTLTNKTINAANNTLSNIPNSALSNSSVTINGTPVSLGTAISVTAETPNELIFSTGLSATSNFDGSQETTVSLQAVGTAGVYGSAGTTPQITVNTVGQVTNITPLNTVITTNNISGSVAIAQGGTGASAAKFAMQNLLPDYAGNSGKSLVLAPNGTDLEWKSVGGVGTVTSVDGSGGTTGLTLTGGPITAAGTLTLGGTLAIASGGTGAATAPNARTNLGLGSAAVLTAGAANGVATLDAGGTVPLSQIPASIQGGVSYQGTWNATTNTPTLTSSVGSKGYYYVVSVAGSTNLNGITNWNIGDWAIFNGTAWEKIDNTDAVTSVNGYTGTVVLTNTDISGFGTMSTQNANAVAITGGTINGTTVGATTPSTVTGTTVTATTLVVNDNSTLGSSNSDTVTFTARVNSDIDPSTNNTYDLGRNAHAWRNLYLTGTANIAALTASGSVTLSGGTANGVTYLNGSKVLTSGSALTFDGTGLGLGGAITSKLSVTVNTADTDGVRVTNSSSGSLAVLAVAGATGNGISGWPNASILESVGTGGLVLSAFNGPMIFQINGRSEGMRLTSSLLSVVSGATIQGLTVGLGAGAVSTNTAVGASALAANTSGIRNTAIGHSALLANTTGTNTAVGYGAAATNTTGTNNAAFGYYSLVLNTTGSNNTALGQDSLYSNTTASNNTAVGYQAGYSNTTGAMTALGYQAGFSNTTAQGHVFVGFQAGYANTGSDNTFVGVLAGTANTTGSSNIALGRSALLTNTTGFANTALGKFSLYFNTTGAFNTAIGSSDAATVSGPLESNTTGNRNVAIGPGALRANTTASENTAVGYQSAYSNTTGSLTAVGNVSAYSNTTGVGIAAIGGGALYTNTTGNRNTAVGAGTAVNYPPMFFNTTGSDNSALGTQTLYLNTTGTNNVAIGNYALQSNTTGSNSVAIGYQAGLTSTTAGNAVFIGQGAGFSTSGTNNCFVGAVAGYSVTSGAYNSYIGTGSGYAMTTGSSNVILGNFSGNGGGLDIRTASNYIVLSDGDGNPRIVSDGAGNVTVGVGNQNGQFTVRNTEGGKATIAALATNTSGTNYGIDSVSYATAANTAALYRGFCGTGSPSQVFQINGFGNIDLFGGNIQFPATQSASANANTLDDYEEGSWTPTDGSGAGLSFSDVAGRYTKIGRQVIAYFNMTFPSTASTAQITIGGLPYNSATSAGVSNPGGGGFTYQTASISNVTFAIGSPSSNFNMWTLAGASVNNVSASTFSLRGYFTYFTD